MEECDRQMASNSSALEDKCACVFTRTQFKTQGNNALDAIAGAETQAACAAASGTWYCHQYDMKKPACLQAEWSQVNNLGNTNNSPNGGEPQSVEWTMPTVNEMARTGCWVYSANVNGQTVEYTRFQ